MRTSGNDGDQHHNSRYSPYDDPNCYEWSYRDRASSLTFSSSSPRNPHQIDQDYRHDAECPDGEPGSATVAKRYQRDDAGQRTDDDQHRGGVDGPVPDPAGVEPLVEIAELSEKSATFFFHFGSAVGPVDGDDGPRARRRVRHLDLIAAVVEVGCRRPHA